jgi:transcriptional regulator with XRE-family HTH domain
VAITSEQSRMARAALRLGVRDLATLANVSPNTVARLERGETMQPRTLEDIQRVLEAAGVEFTDGDAPGVKLKRTGKGDEGLRPDQLTAENDG